MSEVFERLCPHYMHYGMSWEQYWYGDPWAMKDYKDAYNMNCRQQNMMNWLLGAYVNAAVNTALANAFSKKGTPPHKYLEQPFDIFPKTEAEEEAEKERKQRELIAKLSAWKKAFDAEKKNGK